jgi:ATP-grasp domain, R2K clade family 3
MIILSEAVEQVEPSASATENQLLTEAIKLLGCKVYSIPRDFERCSTAGNALWHIPNYADQTAGIWIGYIPELERYEAIYNAALDKNIKLLNTPSQHKTAMEFDLFYPYLQGLTPESITITLKAECAEAANKLGFPLFIKGAIQSRKRQGWKACVADNHEELLNLTEWLLTLKYGSRGRVIVRRLVSLRSTCKAPNGFPMGREFRVFLYNNQVLEHGYYWDTKNELSKLSTQEEKTVLDLAVLASTCLNVPYISIDIGQLATGEWIVIEVGDAQFAGLSHIPILELCNKLKDISFSN